MGWTLHIPGWTDDEASARGGEAGEVCAGVGGGTAWGELVCLY